ncbi:MAG TPA: hypothetical protein VES42_23450 [Pilimelia sp.]|nr:hypothetical protein [Pilimelia sp.]
MIRIVRIAATLATAAVLGAGLAAPAHAAPPEPYCYGGPGPSWETTFKGVRMTMSVMCQWLDVGRSWYFGRARLTLQHDGNLVIYDQSNRPRWATGTNGSGATQLVFQHDGNLVLYTAGYGRAVWASNTRHRCRNASPNVETLGLQSDSNFVIYCRYDRHDPNMFAIWSTGTVF